jgi:hypothetical protein
MTACASRKCRLATAGMAGQRTRAWPPAADPPGLGRCAVIEQILPAGVAWSEAFADLPDVTLSLRKRR